ncbi:hypothetical protein OB955_24435 [Halobacteria archaeon AArc-m2/3/4]|uniref:Uncharacterized protein n=1 Tax=Natronoglomus mannanivorans TaxID=2979990 RepID=A0ABT2QLQ9_9EURY|nr:hypothetical protein [Halobacteria archaeon AArc-m2/3/4]
MKSNESEIDKIIESFDQEVDDRNISDTNLGVDEELDPSRIESLSKEELANEFNGEFAASPTGNVQHLVQGKADKTLCGIDLTEENYVRSSSVGPFNPICSVCRPTIETTNEPGLDSINGVRDWFADELESIAPSEEKPHQSLTLNESQYVIKYIQSLKQEE